MATLCSREFFGFEIRIFQHLAKAQMWQNVALAAWPLGRLAGGVAVSARSPHVHVCTPLRNVAARPPPARAPLRTVALTSHTSRARDDSEQS